MTIQVNLVGLFKIVKFNKEQKLYTQHVNNVHSLCGSIGKKCLLHILEMNMFHLSSLLGLEKCLKLTKSDITARVKQLDEYINGLMRNEGEFIIMGVDMKAFFRQYEDVVMETIENMDFEVFIDKVKNYASPHIVKEIERVGQELIERYETCDYNACLGIMMAVNSWCLNSFMFLMTNIFNLLYLCFLDLTETPACDVFNILPYMLEGEQQDFDELEYIGQKRLVIERYVPTILQQVLLDRRRDIILLRDILAHSNLLKTLNLTIKEDDDCKRIEKEILQCVSREKCVRELFTHLNIRKKTIVPQVRNLYEKWMAAAPHQRQAIYNRFGLLNDEERALFPDIIGCHAPSHERTVEYIRFVINYLIHEDDKQLKMFVKKLFVEFDPLFEHIVFPDYENVVAAQGDDNEIINLNYFENGTYNLNSIIKRFSEMDKETVQYAINRFNHMIEKDGKVIKKRY